MSVVRDRIKRKERQTKMHRLDTLATALKILKADYKPEIATAMMYGFVSIMISDEDAEKVLALVLERYGK